MRLFQVSRAGSRRGKVQRRLLFRRRRCSLILRRLVIAFSLFDQGSSFALSIRSFQACLFLFVLVSPSLTQEGLFGLAYSSCLSCCAGSSTWSGLSWFTIWCRCDLSYLAHSTCWFDSLTPSASLTCMSSTPSSVHVSSIEWRWWLCLALGSSVVSQPWSNRHSSCWDHWSGMSHSWYLWSVSYTTLASGASDLNIVSYRGHCTTFSLCRSSHVQLAGRSALRRKFPVSTSWSSLSFWMSSCFSVGLCRCSPKDRFGCVKSRWSLCPTRVDRSLVVRGLTGACLVSRRGHACLW